MDTGIIAGYVPEPDGPRGASSIERRLLGTTAVHPRLLKGDLVDSLTQMKREAARAAIEMVEPGMLIGVGSGTTVNEFIRLLQEDEIALPGALAASLGSATLLDAAGIPVLSPDEHQTVALYVDGADEVDPSGRMIKGGGGAHALEKAIATRSDCFVCIVDESKLMERLGTRMPVPLEVLPAELSHVTNHLGAMGAELSMREIRADSGNLLLDAFGLDLSSPEELEVALEQVPGVVACGIFAKRRADVALVGTREGVRRIDYR